MHQVSKSVAHLLRVSTARVDGGCLFGGTSKERWEAFVTPDRQNKVAVGRYCMLFRHRGKWVLVNTGPGDKIPSNADWVPVRGRSSLLRDLRELNVSPRTIDVVVMTHLHTEHAGGATHGTDTGRVLPTFSRARYVVQRAAWEEARNPNERSHLHYHPDDFLPLEEAGQVELVDGRKEVLPGVWVEPAPGPAEGHQMVLVEGDGRPTVFLGCLVPTLLHLTPGVVAALDKDPEETVSSKGAMLQRALANQWLLAPLGVNDWVASEDLMSLSATAQAASSGVEAAGQPATELASVAS